MQIDFPKKMGFLLKESARLKILYGGRGGIYGIVNLINGKIYIGSAVYFNRRWSQHKHELIFNKHKNSKLQRAYNKYGEKSFEFCILEIVKDKSKLLEVEQRWLNFIQPSYNINLLASSSFGVKRSEETKQKLSKIKKGKSIHSEERDSACL